MGYILPGLTILFESRKPKPSLLHELERLDKPFQSILQDLGMNCFEFWYPFFCLGQCILLFVVVGVGCFSRNDVFLFDVASIDQALTRIHPVLALCQSVVIYATALLQPVKHLHFLVKSWVNSIAVGQVQHSPCILTNLYPLLEPLDSMSIGGTCLSIDATFHPQLAEARGFPVYFVEARLHSFAKL